MIWKGVKLLEKRVNEDSIKNFIGCQKFNGIIETTNIKWKNY